MFFNKTNSSLLPCLDLKYIISIQLWNSECFSCRTIGMLILLITILCLMFHIRYLIWYKQERCQNALVLSLFLASALVLTISVPSVLIQLFTCRRHCNEIYCRIEGFISYFGGCLCMLIYMVLSINRYFLLCQTDYPLLDRYSAIICWICSIGWTLPPVFGYWTTYVPEGLGFHCSINWNDRSRISFLYILFSFIGIYFIPLLILFVVNLRVHQIIRNIYSPQNSPYSNQQRSDEKSFSLLNRQNYKFHPKVDNQLNIIISYIHKAADRKRLRSEYRFVQAMIFLVSTYIIGWTPYSIIALLQLFHIDFIFQHAFFITLSAVIAKLSVILAPLIYLSIMNFRFFKKVLFH